MNNAFTLIGVVTVAVLAFRTVRWFWKTRNWKPTPWLTTAR
jgi:hypothetical protein